ncbi:acyl-CoA N-acyltransferase [Mycena polygramma]|nr:acyl-CoA N-acyltransferase [Mycena polygramma]
MAAPTSVLVPSAPTDDPTASLADLFTVESAELRAEISARTPILFSAAGEPYLALPAPHERFYLSPERVSDIPADIAMMSDIRVARTLVGPPFPVSPLASKRWLVRERRDVTALFAAYAAGSFLPAACYPFTVLRERRPDGSEEYVGQVTVMYSGDGEKRLTPVNDAWEEWRTRTKVFEIGAAFRPEWHRQGLATAAIGVVLPHWAVTQMGCTELRAECLASNIGSVKVWQKYGFVEHGALRTEVKIDEVKGGGTQQGCVFVWHLE